MGSIKETIAAIRWAADNPEDRVRRSKVSNDWVVLVALCDRLERIETAAGNYLDESYGRIDLSDKRLEVAEQALRDALREDE